MPDFIQEVARIEPLDVVVYDREEKRWRRTSNFDELV
jgi:hypothetical protein